MPKSPRPSTVVEHYRAVCGGLARSGVPLDGPRYLAAHAELQRHVRVEKIEKLVAESPPLTQEQRDKLAELLKPVRIRRGDDGRQTTLPSGIGSNYLIAEVARATSTPPRVRSDLLSGGSLEFSQARYRVIEREVEREELVQVGELYRPSGCRTIGDNREPTASEGELLVGSRQDPQAGGGEKIHLGQVDNQRDRIVGKHGGDNGFERRSGRHIDVADDAERNDLIAMSHRRREFASRHGHPFALARARRRDRSDPNSVLPVWSSRSWPRPIGQ